MMQIMVWCKTKLGLIKVNFLANYEDEEDTGPKTTTKGCASRSRINITMNFVPNLLQYKGITRRVPTDVT